MTPPAGNATICTSSSTTCATARFREAMPPGSTNSCATTRRPAGSTCVYLEVHAGLGLEAESRDERRGTSDEPS